MLFPFLSTKNIVYKAKKSTKNIVYKARFRDFRLKSGESNNCSHFLVPPQKAETHQFKRGR